MPTSLALQPGIILFLALGAVLKLFSVFEQQKAETTAKTGLLQQADIQGIFLLALFLTLSLSLPAVVPPFMLVLILLFCCTPLKALPTLSLPAILPSLILGTSLYWETVLPSSGIETGMRHNFTLGLIGLGFAISGLLPLLKRMISGFWPQLGITTALSLLGGYLLTEHLLLAPKLFPLSLCFLLSAFVTQTFAQCQKAEQPETTQINLLQLATLGILTLLSSRFFGSYGWVVLAAGLLVNTTGTCKGWQAFGLFWLGRTLLQCFLYTHNSNVTGINLNHPYVSAALFASLLLGSSLPSLFSSNLTTTARLVVITLLSTMLPLLSAYLFHEEATGAFLIGFLTIACFQNSVMSNASQLLGVAVAMILTLIMLPDSFTWGNSATALYKMLALALVFAVSALAARSLIPSGKPSTSA